MTILKMEWEKKVCGRCSLNLEQCNVRNAVNWVKDTFVCKNAHVNFIPFNK